MTGNMTERRAASGRGSAAKERQARERKERALAPTHRDHCAAAGRFKPMRSRKRSCGSFSGANGLTFLAAPSTAVCRQRRQSRPAVSDKANRKLISTDKTQNTKNKSNRKVTNHSILHLYFMNAPKIVLRNTALETNM